MSTNVIINFSSFYTVPFGDLGDLNDLGGDPVGKEVEATYFATN